MSEEHTIAEIAIAAPLPVIWEALRQPERIASWFGWDADTLPGEIDFIFMQNATAERGNTVLQFGQWEGAADRFELEPEGETTLLRIMRSGPLGEYDEIAEGWISFVQQLRFLLERHRGEQRRTLHFSGRGDAPRRALGLFGVTDHPIGWRYALDRAPGGPFAGSLWHRSRHQVGVSVDGWGDGLLVVLDRPGGGSATLTTFGLPEDVFAELEGRWASWWREHYAAS